MVRRVEERHPGHHGRRRGGTSPDNGACTRDHAAHDGAGTDDADPLDHTHADAGHDGTGAAAPAADDTAHDASDFTAADHDHCPRHGRGRVLGVHLAISP